MIWWADRKFKCCTRQTEGCFGVISRCWHLSLTIYRQLSRETKRPKPQSRVVEEPDAGQLTEEEKRQKVRSIFDDAFMCNVYCVMHNILCTNMNT